MALKACIGSIYSKRIFFSGHWVYTDTEPHLANNHRIRIGNSFISCTISKPVPCKFITVFASCNIFLLVSISNKLWISKNYSNSLNWNWNCSLDKKWCGIIGFGKYFDKWIYRNKDFVKMCWEDLNQHHTSVALTKLKQKVKTWGN